MSSEALQRDLSEYKQLLAFLSTTQQTQVLAPIDAEGREFWVHALADPEKNIELEIKGKTKTYSQKDALRAVERQIRVLESKLNDVE